MLVITQLQFQKTSITPTYVNVSVVNGQLVVKQLKQYEIDDLANNDLTSLVNLIITNNGAFSGQGSAPTIAVQAAAGVGATADLSADGNPTQNAFRVKLVSGTGPAAGNLFTVTFATPFAFVPKVVWSNDLLADRETLSSVDFTSLTVNGFTFKIKTLALAATTTYYIDFIVIG